MGAGAAALVGVPRFTSCKHKFQSENSSIHKLVRCVVPMPRKLSHSYNTGRARMVDVSDKAQSKREAEASGFVVLKPEVLKALPHNPKGDPLEVARLAGIMAAKRTAELIPMCHPLP